MLGMALHPDFENTPEVFIAYTYGSFSNIRERFVKYTFDGTSLVSPVTLIEDITGNTTHIGARFQFLPDNTLIVSTGDAQNTIASELKFTERENATHEYRRNNSGRQSNYR
jgi:aldose sugar dehydrogenase